MPNEDRYIYICQLLPKETDGAQHQPCLVSSLQLPYGERQVPVTIKSTPVNDTVTMVQDGSFGDELFLVPELTFMFRV
ncbi:hypothetical protein TNCV_4720251 [Trichonephila clavipes]|uniref:Uncharacterized protein n=1 Tax=Trichonephila clavipes TaxID=2585209 RepID=A0A8X7BFQ2_TRICX|nr:hypothetical protein TNCV_4720251 [Trichonephila clavipes]